MTSRQWDNPAASLPRGQGDIEAHVRALLAGGPDRLCRVMGSHHQRDQAELGFMRWRDDCGELLPALIARWVTLAGAQSCMGQNGDPRGQR